MKRTYRITTTFAAPVGRYRGRMYYRFPVRVETRGRVHETYMVSATGADAAAEVLDRVLPACSEPVTVTALGPRGGRCARYRTWEGVIGARMLSGRAGQTWFAWPDPA